MLLAPIIPTVLFALVIVITLWAWVKKRKQKHHEEPYTPASDILSGVQRPYSSTPPAESNKKAAYAEMTQLKEASIMKEKYPIMEDAASFYFPGNKIGVLVIHGFTGTTQSMKIVGQKIAKAGYTVYGPRLTGHGTHPQDMETATYHDWINDVEAGLTKLKEECSSIFVLGLSMGGTLTLYLAEKHPDITGIIPVNAAVHMPEFENNYRQLQETGERFIDGIGSDIKMPDVQELAYDQTPVQAMGELVDLTGNVQDQLAKIGVPSLIFSSKEDHVVPPQNANIIYDAIMSKDKRIVTLENSYHVATLDNDQDTIISETIAFIQRHTMI